MKTAKIELRGRRTDDLLYALDVVRRFLAQDFTSGHNGNEDGSFTFDVSGDEEVIAREHFASEVRSNGYMLFYKGKPIGGASTAPFRGRKRSKAAREDVRMFGESAQRELDALVRGEGEQRYLDAVSLIDKIEEP